MSKTRNPKTSAGVNPADAFDIDLEVPGDKSISHRAAILAGIASGTSHLKGFLKSEDCFHTLQAMEALGAGVERSSETDLKVRGTGGELKQPAGPLDLGNSGTGMRLLTGLLASRPVRCQLTGDASLSSRPMKRIQRPLEEMGARIGLTGERGTAPIHVAGRPLAAIEYALPVASAQVKSCILLAGLFADGDTVVIEPAPTRDHTERMLAASGVDIDVNGLRIALSGCGAAGPDIQGRSWRIPGDFSSAAFWMVAAAGREGRLARIRNVGLNPRRTALIDVLRRMGAQIEVTECRDGDFFERGGEIAVKGCTLKGVEVGGHEIPNLIDELPLVAVAGSIAEGRTVIRDARELRVKESDRIHTMVVNLERMGVRVEERDDGMAIHGGTAPRGATGITSFGDHRIAMAMAVLALYAGGPSEILDIACTETSYPGFWEALKGIDSHAGTR